MFKTYLKKIRYTTFSTQEEFCKKALIPLGTYKNWERGRQLPNSKSWEVLFNFILTTKARADLIEKLERAYIDEKV